MAIEDGRIVISAPRRERREGWAEASRAIAEAEDDALIWPEFGNADDATLTWCSGEISGWPRSTPPKEVKSGKHALV